MNGGKRRIEDFGQTLGHYGIGHGAYLVLPFLGPSSLRDGAGLATDTILFDPIGYVNDVRTRNQIRVVQLVDKRAELLHASDILGSASLDPYAFQRDAYIQYREALVNDKSTSEINYGDSADAGFETYEDETISNKSLGKNHNNKVVLVK
jgi:phospholipid-binding lipoprotein MlaA